MLHISGTGLLKHMFGYLDNLIGGTNSKKNKDSFDDLHQCLVRDAEQQSERDFPSKYHQFNFLMPTLHSVPLTDGSVATVPIIDVKALLIAFLNDPLKMHQENIASNYDNFTGKAKSPTSTLDEIRTGSLWEQARQK